MLHFFHFCGLFLNCDSLFSPLCPFQSSPCRVFAYEPLLKATIAIIRHMNKLGLCSRCAHLFAKLPGSAMALECQAKVTCRGTHQESRCPPAGGGSKGGLSKPSSLFVKAVITNSRLTNPLMLLYCFFFEKIFTQVNACHRCLRICVCTSESLTHLGKDSQFKLKETKRGI